MKPLHDLQILRLWAFLEGTSLLLLLLVAMPLKHALGWGTGSRVLGSVHGLVFMMFVLALIRSSSERGWPRRRFWWAILMSMIPGGTFVLDRAWRRTLAEERAE